MPELPEVTTVGRILNKQVKGKVIEEFNIFYTKLLKTPSIEEMKNLVKGQKIVEVTNVAKYLLIKLEDYVMISHLRMEGKWMIEKPDLYSYPEKHLEAQFKLDDGMMMRYYDTRKFGTLEMYKKEDYITNSSLAKLGPIPMNNQVSGEYLHSKTIRSRKAIKTLLLDQNIIAGLGNIYVNEVLFDAKIHPETVSNELSLEQCTNLIESSDRILTLATEKGGTSIHSFESQAGVRGSFQDYLKVHTKVGQPCPNCNTTIEKIFVNGRGTYYCPNCQK
ncbi:DNA-formamidopyrimidine glycosylase [[Acholeplasma] multilocale]|uniref:DNA-formamidopyrimidine glycosylase n=1 Tax=[Acholeplasma] multilocale TaxID=264638 RepID=UPI0004794D4D|nr:DNA-formamidopyrimidine glycosylase [[Acholeplasma] multilocale]